MPIEISFVIASSNASTVSIAYVYGTEALDTVRDDLEELVRSGKIVGFDIYTEGNIDNLWTNLDKYSIILIDEDCIFLWKNPGPDVTRPIPTTIIGNSFYTHKADLQEWISNGGGLFSCDQNDISVSYKDADNTWWTWLPDALQVESNQYPSDYPTKGYRRNPGYLEVIYDPWIFSTPNTIDITKVEASECHGRFTNYPGYNALVRDKSNGDILEIFRYYGKGVVVLSHLEYETADPWDVDYVENEINFIRPEKKNVELKLYVEDAIAGRKSGSPPIVNKAPGNIIDIIAQVTNEEDEKLDVGVIIEVPSSLILTLKKCFSRENFTDTKETLLPFQTVGNRYNVAISLTNRGAKGSSQQVVWRFGISENEHTDISRIINGEVTVGTALCDKSTAMYKMVSNVKAIIVTNRYLLFKKYGNELSAGASADVEELLNYIYQIADAGSENCIVYYVDHYDEKMKEWNQMVDYKNELQINVVATEIDGFMETWAEKSSPIHLMIIGGDEIIPFYREKDPIPLIANVGREDNYKYNSKDPVLAIIDNGFFPTDAIYADTDGRDWDEGKLELSMGRIVGCSAKDMMSFIQNGIRGPYDGSMNAVVATICPEVDVQPDPPAHIMSKLGEKNFDILNDGNPLTEGPSTIENGNWKRKDLISAMEKGFRTFVFLGHGNYYLIETPDNLFLLSSDNDLNSQQCISNNRPLMVFGACRVGLVTDESYLAPTGETWDPEYTDCMVYALAHYGVSAIVASTALEFKGMSKDQVANGERLVNDYYAKLITAGSRETKDFGSALMDSKRDYDKGWIWDEWDKKTMMEFELYGVPWAIMDPEESTQTSHDLTVNNNSSVRINVSNPVCISKDIYARTIEINVVNYSISGVDGFDLITINGSELANDYHKPIIPIVRIPMILPINCNNVSVTLIDKSSIKIGYYNIPSFEPSVEMEETPTGGYTNITDVVGLYPSPIYQSDMSNYKTYNKAVIALSLVQHDPQTKETIFVNHVKLQISFEAPQVATIVDFTPKEMRYASGKMIETSLDIENTGSDPLVGLQAVLSLSDPQGRIRASSTSTSFDLAPGEHKIHHPTIDQNLPHGTYLLKLYVKGAGMSVNSSTYIYISSGKIVDLSLTSPIKSGDELKANITFENEYLSNVIASGVVYIYDSNNIEIAELYSIPISISPNSTAKMEIIWSTVGKDMGSYRASAVVFVGDEAFGPFYKDFKIIPRLLGDINNDGVVDYKDLAILTSKYNSKRGDTNYSEDVDINYDNIIDYKDLALLVAHYSEHS